MPSMKTQPARTLQMLHPWHGVPAIPAGAPAPDLITTFIEIVPTDTVKYEVDKASGHLKVDRPQKYSSLCPAPYGFVPQTLCADEVGRFAADRAGRGEVIGDGDPLDICVLTERPINHGNILLTARPIGGLRLFDGHEADDKIIAVMYGDPAYGAFTEIDHVPRTLVDRLRHYFLTYKEIPGEVPGGQDRIIEITDVYGAEDAREVIRRSQVDYRALYGVI